MPPLLGFGDRRVVFTAGNDTKEGNMRRFFMLMLVAGATCLAPGLVRAENPNQEAAVRIKDQINKSGQLAKGDKIAVRYLSGTVWLQGHVRDQEHLNRVVQFVFATEGITINQVIRDELVVDTGSPDLSMTKSIGGAANPLRADGTSPDYQAQPLAATFAPTRRAMPVAMEQAVPPPAGPIPSPPVATPGRLPAAEATSGVPGAPLPMYAPGTAAGGVAPVRYDRACMPGYAWPSYAAYPNYAAVTYPKQYSATAWPYIGPFYPYPQVPLGWRKVSLEWDDGWWWLDFKDKPRCCWWR
jgi:hypothetical protein